MFEFDTRRIVLIIIVLALIYIFYYIGHPSNTGLYNGGSDASVIKPEVYAVDLPPNFFKSLYPGYDTSDPKYFPIEGDGYMKNRDGSYLDPTKLNLPLASADQVYQAAMAAQNNVSAVGAQFIGYGLLVNNGKLQLGFPRQTMIDNIGLPNTSATYDGIVPGLFIAYNSKDTPTTAILYGLKPIQGSVIKIAGVDCSISPWFTPDQLSLTTVSSIYSQNVGLNL